MNLIKLNILWVSQEKADLNIELLNKATDLSFAKKGLLFDKTYYIINCQLRFEDNQTKEVLRFNYFMDVCQLKKYNYVYLTL